MCERNIFLTKTYFLPTQISLSVAGRTLGKLVMNLELDMVNRVLKLFFFFSERQIVLKFNHFKHYVNKYVEKTHQVLRDTK